MSNAYAPDKKTWAEIRKWRAHKREFPPPDEIITPEEGQESVWDYPRPPRIEPERKEGAVFYDGQEIARSSSLIRVLERSIPPAYYFPTDDVDMTVLRPNSIKSLCEWKGLTQHRDLIIQGKCKVENAAWGYPVPITDVLDFTFLKNYIAFYPYDLACTLNGEKVEAQKGGFYGGWITSSVLGPFKGEPGTQNW